MKKFNVVLMTALLALGLMFTVPAATADDNGNGISKGQGIGVQAVIACRILQDNGWLELLGYENFGQCVKFFVKEYKRLKS